VSSIVDWFCSVEALFRSKWSPKWQCTMEHSSKLIALTILYYDQKGPVFCRYKRWETNIKAWPVLNQKRLLIKNPLCNMMKFMSNVPYREWCCVDSTGCWLLKKKIATSKNKGVIDDWVRRLAAKWLFGKVPSGKMLPGQLWC